MLYEVITGMQGGPLMHVIAAKAVAFKEALSPSFKRYQQQVVSNAKVLAQGLLDRGYKIVSGGTDTHLMLVNLTNKGITGKEADAAVPLVVALHTWSGDYRQAAPGAECARWCIEHGFAFAHSYNFV